MITRIFFHPDLAKHHGLLGGTLKRLGKVVILAGPNGSGKSRYLRLVQDICTIPFRALVGKFNDYDLRMHEALPGTVFSPENNGRPPPLVHLSYPMNNARVADARNMSPMAIREAADSTSNVGFESALTGMHAYCTRIAHRMYHSRHPQMTEQETTWQQDAKVFNDILRALLGVELGFIVEDTEVLPTFRNRPLVPVEISPGERILLTWAVSLHRQRQALSSAIVLIDEPESHLHHEACIRTLSKLRDDVLGPEGQIWLATHSVPLLAWGGLDSVHFVKDGAIEFAGNKVTSVVESLLGGKEGRNRLKTFLSEADEIAFMEFAVQCVLPAGVADPKTDDKQQLQFIEMINQRLSSQQQIRILDFSAGKGRFGSALRERLSAHEDAPLRQRIEYHAYNVPQITDDDVKRACEARIAGLEQPGPVADYYWESLSKLQARHGQAFNLVILCNVLHEIKPENWLTVFQDIDALLAPDGVLVVMEDLFPHVGELPNERGYLLLDEYGLGLLFGDHKRIKVLQKKEDRLLAVEIPKSLVSRVTKDAREKALRYLQKHAKEQVKIIRSEVLSSPSHRRGREHAHYSMLFTNASLALESE